MKIRCIFTTLLIAAAMSIAAQSRGDVRIYIPPVNTEDPAQADFFRRNFTMELTAAGYTVSENILESDYSMRLSVRRNVTVAADGTTTMASSNDNQYVLQIILMRNSDTAQIVSLSFSFTELEEMYDHNLTLVYQTMANVPLSRGGDTGTLVKYMVGRGEEGGDWWRNKWLYIRLSADYPLSFYQVHTTGLYDDKYLYVVTVNEEDGTTSTQYSRIDRQIVAMPGATAGLEIQFLYWMSLEANFELRLWDVTGYGFNPGIGLQLKFPLKPANHFMIEPYAAAVFATTYNDNIIEFPRYAVGGGIQFGVKGDNRSVLFFDAKYMYPLSDDVTRNMDDQFKSPAKLHWSHFTIDLSLGIKIGLLNRISKRERNADWLFNN